MKMLLVVFVLLCVGAVYCGPSRNQPTPPGPEPTGSPCWDLLRCYPEHSNWYYDDLPLQSWPASTSTTFYVGCKVWRPSVSSCKGYCESSQSITIGTPPRNETDFKCCKSRGYQLVRPYPQCWVIRSSGSVRFETVPQRIENYSYTLAAKCGCLDCGRQLSPEAPEEIGEYRVTGRPTPPHPEQGDELTEALRGIPALRGLLCEARNSPK